MYKDLLGAPPVPSCTSSRTCIFTGGSFCPTWVHPKIPNHSLNILIYTLYPPHIHPKEPLQVNSTQKNIHPDSQRAFSSRWIQLTLLQRKPCHWPLEELYQWLGPPQRVVKGRSFCWNPMRFMHIHPWNLIQSSKRKIYLATSILFGICWFWGEYIYI